MRLHWPRKVRLPVQQQPASTRRRRPAVSSLPLMAHIALLLTVATVVAVGVGALLWVGLGRPALIGPVARPTPSPSGGSPTESVIGATERFDAIKLILTVVGGIGAVVALTVAYRKQRHSEAAEYREDTKLYTDRFGKAADQLGSDKAPVRLAGVYAMAELADDWGDGRQVCIDVLCAYLRMPYTPPPDDQPADEREPAPWAEQREREQEVLARRQERQVGTPGPPHRYPADQQPSTRRSRAGAAGRAGVRDRHWQGRSGGVRAGATHHQAGSAGPGGPRDPGCSRGYDGCERQRDRAAPAPS
jgi:hypothetical protein